MLRVRHRHDRAHALKRSRALLALAALALTAAVGCGAAGFGGGAVLRPGERVPPFRVTTTSGMAVDSAALVGTRPFVLVFFTTWCPACEEKMPIVGEIARELRGDVAVLGVALDEEDTWSHLPIYVARHRLGFPIVRGSDHPDLVARYEPARIPMVVVVGRDGYPVDIQVGAGERDGERLRAAITAAWSRPAAPR